MSSIIERLIISFPENCLLCAHDYPLCSIAKKAAVFWDMQNRSLSHPIYCPLRKFVERNERELNSWVKEYLCQYTLQATPTPTSTGQN